MKKIYFGLLVLGFCACKNKAAKTRNTSFDQWIWQNIVKKGDFSTKDSILKHTLHQSKLQLHLEDTAIATLYHKIGANYQSNGYRKEALCYLDSALWIRTRQLPPHHKDILRSQVVQGVIYVDKAEYIKGSIHLEKILKKLWEAPQQDSVFMGYAYKTLGRCYLEKNDLHQALETYQYALQYIKSSEANYTKCLMDMGVICDLLKKSESSENYYQKALNGFIADEDSFYITNCYHNLAMLQRPINTTKSLQLFQKALDFYEKGSVESANTLLEMAKTYSTVQQFDKAKTLAYESLQIRKNFHKFKHYHLAESHTVLADIAAFQNDFPTALNHFQQATDQYDTLTFTPVQRVEPLFGKAKMLLQMGRKTEAFIIFNTLDSLIQQVACQFRDDKSKFNVLENHFGIYEKAIQTAYELFGIQHDSTFLFQAFQWSAHSKAVALRQAMRDEKAKQFAHIPKDILEKEHILKQEIAFQQKQMADNPSADVQKQWFQAKENWHQWIQDLEFKYPNYHHLKYAVNQPFNISKLQQSLPKEMLCLEFFVGDNTIFAFAVTPHQIKIYPIRAPHSLDSMIIPLHQSLIYPKSQLKKEYLKNAHALYQLLLEAPLKELNSEGKITRLRIIPDGKLGYIPFDALLTQPAEDWDDKRSKKVPYLLRSYSTSYSYFADSVFNNQALKIKNNFCGFGIDYRDSLTNRSLHHKLGYLDHAPKEVDSIKQFIGGKIWTNRAATKQCFLRYAAQSGIFHLSMHSMTDDKNPLEAQLIFSKQDSLNDNLLIGNELFAQQFTCGLGVLSACRTGEGKLQRGEGIMSLARAFAYSGCPSLVMSLWSIPDRSTSNIMLHFYKNLKQNLPKDVALQQSKLQYLDNLSFEPSQKIPNYWAATVLIGDVNALHFEHWYEKYGLFVLVAIGLLLFWKLK